MTRRVLLIGATGQLGRHFVPALREEGNEVVALLRPETVRAAVDEKRRMIDSFVHQGMKIFEGSLDDVSSVERACADVDAVVSCIDHRPDHLKLQLVLAQAAAKSGRIRRIVPSQFGIDSRTYQPSKVGHGDIKRELQQTFDSCGVPVTYVHANGFASAWAASLGQLGLREPPQQEIEVYGDGNVQFSMAAAEDIARYAARALFDTSTEDRHTLIIPSENVLTQNALIAIWEAKTGSKLRRRTVSAREIEERILDFARTPEQRVHLALAQLIRAAWIDGLGSGTRRPDVLELTELYPEIQYQRVTHYLDRFVPAARAMQ